MKRSLGLCSLMLLGAGLGELALSPNPAPRSRIV